MPKEQREYIEKIQKDCLESTNMTESEAWTFAFRCWQLDYVKKGRMTDKEVDVLLDYIVDGGFFDAICDVLDKTDYCEKYCGNTDDDYKNCVREYARVKAKECD
jgi:hypothetical protein